MKTEFVAVLVFGGGRCRIGSASELDAAFRQWSHRHGLFLPVAVFPLPARVFNDAFSIRRLPTTVSTEWAAEHLHRAPIALGAQPAVIRHIRRLGSNAAPLFDEWRTAVDNLGVS